MSGPNVKEEINIGLPEFQAVTQDVQVDIPSISAEHTIGVRKQLLVEDTIANQTSQKTEDYNQPSTSGSQEVQSEIPIPQPDKSKKTHGQRNRTKPLRLNSAKKGMFGSARQCGDVVLVCCMVIPHDENLLKAEKDKVSKYLDLAHEVTVM